MNIAFFGSSLVSAYWNSAATYYRGIIRALACRGHRVTFYEPDAFERQAHRDLDDPPWATVVVYPATPDGVERSLNRARGADVVVKASGVGIHDGLLEAGVASLRGPRTAVAFWDVDAPATLHRLERDASDPFHALIPRYDLVLTYGGGASVVDAYGRLGARRCVPIYNALDPSTHFPVPPDPRFEGALGFLGNRLPDREHRVDEFFVRAAAALTSSRFLLAGAGWESKRLPGNVQRLGHLTTREHNVFNVTPLAILNVNREQMAARGHAPPPRIFEAAGAGACLISDAWDGLDRFLEPGSEILTARSGDEVADQLAALTRPVARAIGVRARRHVLSAHTYQHRAIDVEAAFDARPRAVRSMRRLRIVMLGLSITSSWGNGHATTYRSLIRELASRGHQVLFLERDLPWYAAHRDHAHPAHAQIALYRTQAELHQHHERAVRDADLVMVGLGVPDGVEIGTWVVETARGITAFYDIDTPVTLARLATGDCSHVSPELIRRYAMYLSSTGGPILARIERELGSPRARTLYASADPTVYYPEPHARRWDLGWMGTYSGDRQPALDRLLLEPARRETARTFVVAGAGYPEAIAWPATVQRIEHLAPPEHREFYNRMAFALNVTRRDMAAAGWSPSVRLFEAAACGVPIISDRWDGLDEVFVPGREILLAAGADDVQRLLRDTGEPARQAIGARARARVLADHTAAHRAADLEGYVCGS